VTHQSTSQPCLPSAEGRRDDDSAVLEEGICDLLLESPEVLPQDLPDPARRGLAVLAPLRGLDGGEECLLLGPEPRDLVK
jgi:hypothetical protein